MKVEGNSLARRENSLQNLNKFLIEKKSVPFEWGTWDCCTFSADCVLTMTGEDKLEIFRGTYDSKYTAAKMLREIGSGTLDSTLRDHLGDTIPPHRAWRGDLAIHKNNVGVCVGMYAYFVAEKGLMLISMSDIDKVYPIR